VLGATFAEIDREAKIWRVPPERMKMKRLHEVPLSDRALALIDGAADRRKVKPTDFIFHGPREADPLSNMSMAMLMRRMKVEATPHGFRSSFRDWAGVRTNFARDVVELALAHQVGDDTERAYRRSSALEKRRKLMDAWARFARAPTPMHKSSHLRGLANAPARAERQRIVGRSHCDGAGGSVRGGVSCD
jgi:integrase